MSTDLHDRVFDILVRECKAIEHNRAAFHSFDLTTPGRFVFGGQLGLDGALVVDDEGVWLVTMHAEDYTPKRHDMRTRANAALHELQGA